MVDTRVLIKATVLCGDERFGHLLGNLVKLYRDTPFFTKLGNQLSISTEYLHRGLELYILQGGDIRQFRLHVQVETENRADSKSYANKYEYEKSFYELHRGFTALSFMNRSLQMPE